MKKLVIYSVLFDHYDDSAIFLASCHVLQEAIGQQFTYDIYLFVDNDDLNNNNNININVVNICQLIATGKIRDHHIHDFSNNKYMLMKYIKICLPCIHNIDLYQDYEYSLWLDGNVTIQANGGKGDINNIFLADFMINPHSFHHHADNDRFACDIAGILRTKRETYIKVKDMENLIQAERNVDAKFNADFKNYTITHLWGGFFIRKNIPAVVEIMCRKYWFDYVKRICWRDQLSCYYSCHLTNKLHEQQIRLQIIDMREYLNITYQAIRHNKKQ